jgi:hypothetical protein
MRFKGLHADQRRIHRLQLTLLPGILVSMDNPDENQA